MKKLSLFVALLLPLLNYAQVTNENFDSYNVGSFDPQWNPTQWTGWFGGPSNSDISNVQSRSMPNSVLINSTSDDLVALLGMLNTGTYEIKFYQYIPSGFGAYFNLQHNYTNTAGDWSTEVYFGDNTTNAARIQTDGQSTNFTPVFNQWVENKFVYDFANDVAEYYYNGTLIHTWQASTNAAGGAGLNQLNGINFYGSCDGPGCTTTAYYDDLTVVQTIAPAQYDAFFESISNFMPYTHVPTALLLSGKLEAEVKNQGTLPVTNVVVTFKVKDGGGNVLHTVSAPAVASLGSGQAVTVTAPTSYTPQNTDTYTVECSVSINETDQNTSNDISSVLHDLVVTDSLFAKDDGNYTNGIGANNNTPLIGQNFEFAADATVLMVSMAYGGGAVGDEIQVFVYATDPATQKPVGVVAQSDVVSLTQAGTVQSPVFLDIPLTAPASLTAGTYSFVVHQKSLINLLLSTTPNIFTPETVVASLDGGATWSFLEAFGFEFALSVRPVLQFTFTGTELASNYIDRLQISPNPTSGIATIDLSLEGNHNVQMDVFDAQGRIVRHLNKANFTTQQTVLDLTDQPNGLYMIRVLVDDQVITRRLMIAK